MHVLTQISRHVICWPERKAQLEQLPVITGCVGAGQGCSNCPHHVMRHPDDTYVDASLLNKLCCKWKLGERGAKGVSFEKKPIFVPRKIRKSYIGFREK